MQARATAPIARTIFLVATEASGDRLGANLMKVLRQRLGDAALHIRSHAFVKKEIATCRIVAEKEKKKNNQ